MVAAPGSHWQGSGCRGATWRWRVPSEGLMGHTGSTGGGKGLQATCYRARSDLPPGGGPRRPLPPWVSTAPKPAHHQSPAAGRPAWPVALGCPPGAPSPARRGCGWPGSPPSHWCSRCSPGGRCAGARLWGGAGVRERRGRGGAAPGGGTAGVGGRLGEADPGRGRASRGPCCPQQNSPPRSPRCPHPREEVSQAPQAAQLHP